MNAASLCLRCKEFRRGRHNDTKGRNCALKIGNLEWNGTVALAPMAGVADQAFRELCVAFGASYVVSEMVSSKGLHYSDRKSAELMAISDKERPAGIQLFGDDPAVMAEAARRAMEYAPDAIDINMGCPAPKVNAGGGGASLMKNPTLCAKIVEATANAVPVPVTVKLRKGWDEHSVNAIEVAQLCESAGAQAITIHGRTRAQMYAPAADWAYIAALKRSVKIPVIGNGDITTPEDAARMLEETGCDAVMIGRGACGNPWIFQRTRAWLEEHRQIPEPGAAERMRVMCRHMEKLCALRGEANGMREARKHAAWYVHGLKGAAGFRREAGELCTLKQLYRLAAKVICANEENA